MGGMRGAVRRGGSGDRGSDRPGATGTLNAFVATDAEPLLPFISRSGRRLASHQPSVDAAVAGVLAVGASGPLVRAGEGRWWVFVLCGASILPLALRRRYPFTVFWVVVVGALVLLGVQAPVASGAGVLLALYTVAAHEPRRRAVLAAVVVEIGALPAAFAVTPREGGTIASIIFITGLVTTALFIGTTLRNRRAYLAALEDRALRAEREREHLARLAVTAERTRIAREMHDVVVHGLSVMIALADGAVAAGRGGPKPATDAMRLVSSTGRTSMVEMRRLLGVLRDDERGDGLGEHSPDLAPQPSLDRLDTLVEAVRSAGLPVALQVTGTPRPLQATAEATVYRLVQEALTNAMRHAVSPTRVSVAMRWTPDALHLDVVDDGQGAPEVRSGSGTEGTAGGHGLTGMRERVALFEGTFAAGPSPSGGWGVHVVLPVGSPA